MLRLQRTLIFVMCLRCSGVFCYTQIALSGIRGENDGPRIYKALNTDLLFPKVFNSSDNVFTTTQTPMTTTTTNTSSKSLTLQDNDRQQMSQLEQQQTNKPIYVTPASIDSEHLEHFSEDLKNHQLNENVQHQEFVQHDQQLYEQQHYSEEQAEEAQLASTGRAIDYNQKYPLGQLINPLIRKKPATTQRLTRPKPLPYVAYYPDKNYDPAIQAYRRQPSRAELNKLRGKGKFEDRFTPSEAVASSQFGKNKHHHDHSKTPAASSVVQSYVTPTDLYAFPPNINAQYPSPAQDPKGKLPAASVSSYLALPSGPLTNTAGYPLASASSNENSYKYPPPSTSSAAGYQYNDPGSNDQKSPAMDSDDADNGDDTVGVLPASAQDNAKPTDGGEPDPHQYVHDHDHDHSHDHSHEHSHDHIPSDYDPNKEYPTPPPGWMEEHPVSMQDHPHHDDHHDHFPSYPTYDDHALTFDDHYHHHHVEPMTTTEPPPPPEPAPEPRVKKYSYFYIGRKLWYIPLYFTVWFSFYVLWLIVKSIARHKVNLPNHYVNRRSLPDYSNKNNEEYINEVTVSVLQQIEDFKKKLF